MMTKEVFIEKILHIIYMSMREKWDLGYIIENIERLIETYRMTMKVPKSQKLKPLKTKGKMHLPHGVGKRGNYA